MTIVCVDDNGKVEKIKCWKIEPATLSPGRIIVNEGESIIDICNVTAIVEG